MRRYWHTFMTFTLAVMVVIAWQPVQAVLADAPVVEPLPSDIPPAPGSVSQPEESPGPIQRIIQSVTHRISISPGVVFNAVNQMVNSAATQGMAGISASIPQVQATLANVVAALFQPDDLRATGRSVIPIAAGLAVPFFLLRLALYQWDNLSRGQDSIGAVVQDWVVAGAWVVLSPEVVAHGLPLGIAAIQAMWQTSLVQMVAEFFPLNASLSTAQASWLLAGPILAPIAVLSGLGIIAAIIAMAWAFVTASSVAFALSALGPIVGVMGVVPYFRWVRGLWSKAVVLLALFPVIIGVLIKALTMIFSSMPLNSAATPLDLFIRMVWLWGAVGMMFSLAGMTGRFTIGAGGQVAAGMVSAGRAVIDKAVAASVIGGGGGAMVAGGLAALSTLTGGAGGGSADTGSELSGAPAALPGGGNHATAALGQAMQHSGQAQRYRRDAAIAAALGLRGASAAFGWKASNAMLEAREHELSARLAQMAQQEERWAERASVESGEAMSPLVQNVASQVSNTMGGPYSRATIESFTKGLRQEAGDPSNVSGALAQIKRDMSSLGLYPEKMLEQYPKQMGALTAAYQRGVAGGSARERLTHGLKSVKGMPIWKDAGLVNSLVPPSAQSLEVAMPVAALDMSAIGIPRDVVDHLGNQHEEGFASWLSRYPIEEALTPAQRLEASLKDAPPAIRDTLAPYIQQYNQENDQ